MTPDTSGPPLRTPFVWYDHEGCCWRTCEATFPWASDEFSETWPSWGMTVGGASYALPTPALPTDEPGSSSWLPTPATTNGKSTRAMTASTENGRRSGGGQSSPPGLEETVEILQGRWPAHMPPVESLPPATLALLPTPVVNDMGARKTPEEWDAWTDRMKASHGNGNGHGPSLSVEALRLLPTPTTDDAGNLTRNSGDFQSLTRTAVSLLPTPTASDTNGAGAHGDGGPDLRTAVSLLPTPTASDWKGPNRSGSGSASSSGIATRVDALLPSLGAPTPPPSPAGSTSPEPWHPGQLSLDDLASD